MSVVPAATRTVMSDPTQVAATAEALATEGAVVAHAFANYKTEVKVGGDVTAGRDVLVEHGGEGLYQPVDLGIAVCRMMVAVKKGFDYDGAVRKGARLRVATKYVNTTREHFAAKGVHVDLIRLYGSMELAPLVGLADAIVDLVSTGHTLKANDLVPVEEIMPVSARLIVNQAALKTKRAALQPLIEAFATATGK